MAKARKPVRSPRPVLEEVTSSIPPPRDISFQEIIGRQQVELEILRARVEQLTALLMDQEAATNNSGGTEDSG